MTSLNAILDTLPRARLQRFGRAVPTYRGLGIVGFYGALIVTLAAGFLTSRSLLVLAILSLVCAASFFVYAYVRRLITGQERIVLLEHVWFALALSALTLWSRRMPVAGYLDIVAVGMSAFLAAGRVGCTLVGCCHGNPASIGLKYGESHAAEGFPRHLVGVRLFPVPALESLGLAAIGVSGFAALRFAAPGTVLAWFLAAYAILRFGLEGLRGDTRPHLLGLSAARWMCLAQFGAVLWWSGRAYETVERAATAGLLGVVLAGALLWKSRSGMERVILAPEHVGEIGVFVRTQLECSNLESPLPIGSVSSRGVSIAVSRSGHADWAHVSLGLPGGHANLALLCELAAQALSSIDSEGGFYTDRGILHLPVRFPLDTGAPASGRQLYGDLVRRLQCGEPREQGKPTPSSWVVRPAAPPSWCFVLGDKRK